MTISIIATQSVKAIDEDDTANADDTSDIVIDQDEDNAEIVDEIIENEEEADANNFEESGP